MRNFSSKGERLSAAMAGVSDSFSFLVPFVVLYFAFGALGATAGKTLTELLASTALVFSTPLQFVILQNEAGGVALIPVILAMNARFALMSFTLIPFVKEKRFLTNLGAALLMVPSVFTACLSRFKSGGGGGVFYLFGIGGSIYATSLLFTYLGYRATDFNLSQKVLGSMAFLLAIQFAVLTAKLWQFKIEVVSFGAAFFVAPLLSPFFKQYNMAIVPFLIGGVALLCEEVADKKRTAA